MSDISEGLKMGISELCATSRIGTGTVPKDIKNWGNELAIEILSYLKSQVEEVKLPDNKYWHKNEREFEAYCAGRNDVISTIHKLLGGS